MSTPHILVFYGTKRLNPSAPKVAQWLKGKLNTETRATFEFIDLAELDLPLFDIEWPLKTEGPFPTEIHERWSKEVARADAFIVVTNEYNHSISPTIKNAIDYLHSGHWEKKPVGIMSYGGVSGGIRAAEHLRHVFAELYAMTIREQLVVHLSEAFDESNNLKDTAVIGNFEKFTDLLLWWTNALKSARA